MADLKESLRRKTLRRNYKIHTFEQKIRRTLLIGRGHAKLKGQVLCLYFCTQGAAAKNVQNTYKMCRTQRVLIW
jgi:hypothetical protein